MKQSFNVRQITLIGLLGGLSAIVFNFEISIPFMPPFMTYDPSAIIEVIGGFVLGPVPAFFIILIKNLIKIIMPGTTSAFTGEIQNVLVSCAYAVPAAFIYKRKKNRKGAIVGMALGTIVCAIVAVLTNIYFIIPFYVKLMGMSMDSIIKMCTEMNPYMTDMFSIALFGIIPFNLLKFGANSLLSALVYKRVSSPLKNILNERR